MATYVYGPYELWTQINVNFRSWFAYTVSSTDTTYSITVYAGPQLSGNTGTVKCSLTCKLTATGQTDRSTTKTFSTDSDDSSKRMTFLASKKWTWNKTSSSQNITIKATVDRANMTASTATKTFTIPALDSYNVSYNSNGGSGSIATQKKYYGKSLTLSNGSGLSKSGNTLKNWNTAANGTGTSYELGQTYTSNKALALYAQWSTDYSITDVKANRVDESGNELSRSEYIYIAFNYNTLNTTGVSYSISVDESTIESGVLSSTTGTIEHFSTDETYSLDETHSVVINVGGITKTTSVPIAVRPIDIMGNGNNISMGVMAPANPDVPLMLTPNMSIDSSGNVKTTGKLMLEGHDGSVGIVQSKSASMNIDSGTTWVEFENASLSLSAGSYIITVTFYCGTLASGKRLGVRLYNQTTANEYTDIREIAHTSNTSGAAVSATGGVRITSATSFCPQVFQTQGSQQSCYGYIRVIRIA